MYPVTPVADGRVRPARCGLAARSALYPHLVPLTVEFTVEPFVDGEPGPHVQAAVDAAEASGLTTEFGPFRLPVQVRSVRPSRAARAAAVRPRQKARLAHRLPLGAAVVDAAVEENSRRSIAGLMVAGGSTSA